MADIFTSDFEGATPFSGWTTAAATVTQNTSTFHGGAASAKFDATTATQPLLTKSIAGSPATLVAQWWFFVPASVPNGYTGVTVLRLLCPGFNVFFKLNNTGPSFQLQMQMSDGANTVEQHSAYTEDTWTRLTLRALFGSAPVTVEWNVGTAEQTTVQWALGGTNTFTGFNLGYAGGAAGLVFYGDDVRLSTTSTDYDVYKGTSSSATSRMALLGVG
jgi:hypothetical protein